MALRRGAGPVHPGRAGPRRLAVHADLTAALRSAQAATFAEPPAPVRALDAPVVLLLSGSLELLDQTPRTDAHLRLLLPTSPGAAPVPAAAFNVAAQLLAVEAGVDNGLPTARAQLAGPEWISLRAARLAGPVSQAAGQRDGSGRRPATGQAADGEASAGAGQRSGQVSVRAGQRAASRATRASQRDAGQPDGGRIAVTVEPVALAGRIELYGRACGLTGRERELLHRLARGADTRLLAREMRLSPHTVQDHLKSVFAKTGCGSRGVLLARALGTGTGAGQTGPGQRPGPPASTATDPPAPPATAPGPGNPGRVNGGAHRPAQRPTGRRPQQWCRGQANRAGLMARAAGREWPAWADDAGRRSRIPSRKTSDAGESASWWPGREPARLPGPGPVRAADQCEGTS